MAKNRVDSGRGRGPGVVKQAKKGAPSPLFYLLIAVVAIVGVGALAYVASKPKASNVSQIDPNLPPVKSEGYVMGSPTAPVEVIEFADFECPVCAEFAAVTEPDIRSKLINTGEMRLRFIDYPLPMHKNTWNASRAAACADEQGKFWAMHDALFQTQDKWNGEATDNPDKFFKGLASQLGLDQSKFNDCVDSKRMQAKIQAHEAIAEQQHATATPSFIIGGKLITGAPAGGYDEFKRLVDEARASAPASPLPTPTAKTDSVSGTGAKPKR